VPISGSNNLSYALIADAVWDEAYAGHTAGAIFGQLIKTTFDDAQIMVPNYSRRTLYTYGPTNLAAGATFVPAAGTVVTIASLSGVAANDFMIVHGAITVMQAGALNQDNPLIKGYVGMLYCDGTNVGIKNNDVAGRDLSLEGITP